MSLFDRFKDGQEKAFRDEFVKPLLTRLGFHGVEQKHGSQEYGKDLVFSEVHRLSGVRNYAAQVKHIETLGQSDVDDLLRQIREAFEEPYIPAVSPHECFVCAVFVFNSGKITDNARESISAHLRKQQYGDNVILWGGERLDMLNQYATYDDERDVRARMSGMLAQIALNRMVSDSFRVTIGNILDNQKGYEIESRGIMLSAAEDILTRPLVGAIELLNAVASYYQVGKIVNLIQLRLSLAIMNDDARKRDVQSAHKLLNESCKPLPSLPLGISRLHNDSNKPQRKRRQRTSRYRAIRREGADPQAATL